jgi:hypothetical protein|tara:strand:- start:311 stop:970 length:660 start_codon:yes stop_codon:yes gene_type:complete
MAMTYTSLKTDIQTWAENTGTDFTNQLDTFIDNTQIRLSREIDPVGFNENVTSSMSVGDRFITLPTNIDPMLINYLNIIVSDDRKFLEIKPIEYLQEYWPDSSLKDQPRYFANFNDTTLYVAPTPDQAYVMELGYQGRINPLSNTNTTNWYTDNAPDALLYGCLSEANLFTKNMEDYNIYKQKYVESVTALNNEARRRRRTDYKFPGSPLGENTLTGGQ